jgi:Sulfatase
MMETYAGFATHTDEQVGRLVDALQQMGALDDTLSFYLLGDNGASAEAGPDGTLNEFAQYNIVSETVSQMLERIDEIGGPSLFNHYPVGWAHAMNAPYQWTKQIASHWGGTRNGMIVHWPNGFRARGEIRDQFTHCIDIGPTILAAADLPEPTMVNGVAQKPLEGASFTEALADASATEHRRTQYFEMFGNRGIYHEGWSACTIHAIPWVLTGEHPPLADDDWELYAPDDHSQATNIAADNPDTLARLQELFLIEAAKYNVFPIDDRKAERLDPVAAGRPDLMGDRTTLTLYPGATHLGESTVPNVKNRSHTVTAEIDVADTADGAIVAQGGRFGGWTLYLNDGVPAYCHNWVDHEYYYVRATEALPAGRHTVRFEFDYDGGGPGKGGAGRLLVDGRLVGEGRIDNTCGYMYATTDGLDIGRDTGAPVIDHYQSAGGVCTADIHSVTIDIAVHADHDAVGLARAILARQ